MMFIRSVLFEIWLYVWMAIFGIVCAPLALFSQGGAYWTMKAYSRHVVFMLRWLCGIRVEVRGAPPSGAHLIASKHQSFLDMCIFMMLLDQPKYIFKQELKWLPIFGFYAMRIGSVPVTRGRGAAAIKQMTDGLMKTRKDGDPIVIFPQGTRVGPGVKAPYKIGAWRLYNGFGVPCAPVATNVGLFWGRRALRKTPGTAVYQFLDEIEPGLESESFMAVLEGRIEGASAALVEEARKAAEERKA